MTGTVPGDWVVAVDSGGTGLRVAVARAGAEDVGALSGTERAACAEPVRIGPEGIDPQHLAAQAVPVARDLLRRVGATGCVAACVGAAGMATLGSALRDRLPREFGRELGARHLTLAADAVTAYTGALGIARGAVVAAGTGMIALGTDLRSWRRADGWGHLLGDCGGGAWIGRAGLEAALRAHDGREGGSAALLREAEAAFGPAGELPGLVYPRPDRPAALASFAPRVAACAAPRNGAAEGDPVAREILRGAAREIACSTAAVCPAGEEQPPVVALTGGLFRIGDALLGPLEEELTARLPRARRVPAAGDPLDGALLLAALPGAAPRVPTDPGLLTVHSG
ncbi:N-acetylglucosamine kinase [Streptomyces sp. TR06-5]|uniref:N-acetylglucosamine kinase n=1 Tax=unclassified Streptomyces TaxID=2593676 RepID=UPI0039A11DD2